MAAGLVSIKPRRTACFSAHRRVARIRTRVKRRGPEVPSQPQPFVQPPAGGPGATWRSCPVVLQERDQGSSSGPLGVESAPPDPNGAAAGGRPKVEGPGAVVGLAESTATSAELAAQRVPAPASLVDATALDRCCCCCHGPLSRTRRDVIRVRCRYPCVEPAPSRHRRAKRLGGSHLISDAVRP